MFKSIQYKLNFYTALLVLAVAGTTITFVFHEYMYAVAGIIFTIYCLFGLDKCYKRYNSNIIFLLNALDIGD